MPGPALRTRLHLLLLKASSNLNQRRQEAARLGGHPMLPTPPYPHSRLPFSMMENLASDCPCDWKKQGQLIRAEQGLSAFLFQRVIKEGWLGKGGRPGWPQPAPARKVGVCCSREGVPGAGRILSEAGEIGKVGVDGMWAGGMGTVRAGPGLEGRPETRGK